jgi:hypothetical protein
VLLKTKRESDYETSKGYKQRGISLTACMTVFLTVLLGLCGWLLNNAYTQVKVDTAGKVDTSTFTETQKNNAKEHEVFKEDIKVMKSDIHDIYMVLVKGEPPSKVIKAREKNGGKKK